MDRLWFLNMYLRSRGLGAGGQGRRYKREVGVLGNTRKIADLAATVGFHLAAAVVIAVLVFLLSHIAVAGWKSVDWDFITSPSRNLEAGGGIAWQIFDSLYLLVLTMVITVPIGIGSAIYLSEYARPGFWTSAIRMAVETLSSLPSIVVGLFGLLAFVTYTGWGYSLLAGTLAISVLTLPVMVRVAEDAIQTVPRELREASLALGATKWQTICRVVVPAALPRLITGGLLAAGRVFGEAAVLIYTAGMSSPPLNWSNFNPFSFSSPLNLLRPGETLAVHIWKVNSESLLPDVRMVADGSAFVLVAVVLFLNGLARYTSHRIERKMMGMD